MWDFLSAWIIFFLLLCPVIFWRFCEVRLRAAVQTQAASADAVWLSLFAFDLKLQIYNEARMSRRCLLRRRGRWHLLKQAVCWRSCILIPNLNDLVFKISYKICISTQREIKLSKQDLQAIMFWFLSNLTAVLQAGELKVSWCNSNIYRSSQSLIFKCV